MIWPNFRTETEAQMLERGLIRPGHYALTGSVKLETAARLAAVEALPFAKTGQTALYNPHFDPKLTSWTRFIAPLLAEYAKAEDRNLIAAPHVKWLRRSAETTRRRWRGKCLGPERVGDLRISPFSAIDRQSVPPPARHVRPTAGR